MCWSLPFAQVENTVHTDDLTPNYSDSNVRDENSQVSDFINIPE